MIKEVKKFKDGKVTKEMCESDGVHLEPASTTIEKYWYEIIKDVFNYEMRREAEMQEVHKLFEDKRVLEGLKLYKEGKVKEGAVTDVDVRATVEGEKQDYMVTMKRWKPLDKFDKVKLLRYRYEIEEYIATMFFDCSCQDHMIMHYKANSSCACKHICAVMWKLMSEDHMPKMFITPKEKQEDWYEKSKSLDIEKNIYGVSMKQFSQYMNILILKDFKGIPTSLAYSIHKEPNAGYENKYPGGIQPTWITFTEPGDVERVIKGNIRGFIEMLASRGNTEEEIIKAVNELYPFTKTEPEIKEVVKTITSEEDKKKIEALEVEIAKLNEEKNFLMAENLKVNKQVKIDNVNYRNKENTCNQLLEQIKQLKKELYDCKQKKSLIKTIKGWFKK